MSPLSAIHRLASYGTLAPGRSNYAQVADLGGTWRVGHVMGRHVQSGWGTWIGYPGFVPDPAGDRIEVHILETDLLPDHWERLDAFEGDAYRRIVVTAELEDGGLIDVSIYEALPE
ncbi:MAG: gamma-glutamylcyclotransferase family protein [Pseudomonadota bacterium]